MDQNELEEYLNAKPYATDDYPFGSDVHVFRVGGKMFALIGESTGNLGVNLKCDPDEATALRDVFEGVTPGYHMNKVHWNTVVLESDVPRGEIQRMVDNSYDLIFKSLTKRKIQALENS